MDNQGQLYLDLAEKIYYIKPDAFSDKGTWLLHHLLPSPQLPGDTLPPGASCPLAVSSGTAAGSPRRTE